jgi:hypothetical protein
MRGSAVFIAGAVVAINMISVANAQSVGPWLRSWAIERMQANAESAGQEKTAVCQGVKVLSGISCRAIEEHGWAGGDESVIRRPLGAVGKQIGLDIKLF